MCEVVAMSHLAEKVQVLQVWPLAPQLQQRVIRQVRQDGPGGGVQGGGGRGPRVVGAGRGAAEAPQVVGGAGGGRWQAALAHGEAHGLGGLGDAQVLRVWRSGGGGMWVKGKLEGSSGVRLASWIAAVQGKVRAALSVA